MMRSFIACSVAFVAATAVHLKTQGDVDLVDVTDIIKDKSGTRCCCDSPQKGSISDFMGNQGRGGRCQVFETRQNSCSKVQSPSWAGGRPLRHYPNRERCMIHKTEVKDVYVKHGSPNDYCGALQSSPVKVGAAALNAYVPVQCEAGYEPTSKQTQCSYASELAGEFLPKPACVLLESWCPESSSQYFAVSGAALGSTSLVQCALGMEPESPEVTCTANKQFFPTPRCVMKADFCQAIDSAEAKYGAVESAAYGESKWVTCYANGYVPQTKYVQCGVAADGFSGGFWPEGPYFCQKDPNYCPGITADMLDFIKGRAATVDPGAIDEDQVVRCREGFQASHFSVRCGSDKQFHPTPSCSKILDWCQSIEQEDAGGVFVPAAGRDDSVLVQCDRGFHPAHARVQCGRNHQWNPSPSCVQD